MYIRLAFDKQCLESEAVFLKLAKRIHHNIQFFQQQFNNSTDLVVRQFTINIPGIREIAGALIFFDGLISNQLITDSILDPILHEASQFQQPIDADILTFLKESVLTNAEHSETNDADKVTLAVMMGEVALLIDGYNTALTIAVQGWAHRSIQSPQSEGVIRGPRDSFVEAINPNLMLIRRRLRDPSLVFERIQIGNRGQNDVVIAYIKDIANEDLVLEVRKRLKKVDLDVILDSGYIEQLIEDDWWSPFNTIQDTERPDEVVAGLTEGRVAILVDNSPFALLAPTTFNTQMMSPEDYYVRWPAANFVRLIRFIASFVSFVTPSLYIALISFHPEMIPTQLALSVAASREGLPFPSFIEALIMELSLELLREAGIRLPGPIGQTIGIVGGLVIGEAAVNAGIVSPIMVIVVAMTAIAGFVIPTYTLSFGLRITRFFLMIAASFFGLYGLTLGLLIILGHLATLTSFGVSYLSPWAPLNLKDLRDSVIRFPWHSLKQRPRYTLADDPTRQSQDTPKRGQNKQKRGKQ